MKGDLSRNTFDRALHYSAVRLQQGRIVLGLVVAWIERLLADPEYSVHSKEALTEWLELIRSKGLPGVLAALEDRSEEGQRMRQSSPFAVLMPQDERQRILDRYEALRPRTHLAGV